MGDDDSEAWARAASRKTMRDVGGLIRFEQVEAMRRISVD